MSVKYPVLSPRFRKTRYAGCPFVFTSLRLRRVPFKGFLSSRRAILALARLVNSRRRSGVRFSGVISGLHSSFERTSRAETSDITLIPVITALHPPAESFGTEKAPTGRVFAASFIVGDFISCFVMGTLKVLFCQGINTSTFDDGITRNILSLYTFLSMVPETGGPRFVKRGTGSESPLSEDPSFISGDRIDGFASFHRALFRLSCAILRTSARDRSAIRRGSSTLVSRVCAPVPGDSDHGSAGEADERFGLFGAFSFVASDTTGVFDASGT